MINIKNQFSSSLNNTLNKKSNFCILPFNNFNLNICKIFYKYNYIFFYKKIYYKKKNYIILYFKSILFNKQLFNCLKTISKPSKRKNWSYAKLKKEINKTNSFYILSTNKGIISGIDCIKYKIGGEILFQIY